ncbi:MAG: hypothetical protein ACK5Z5_00180 [Neisseriaceae bacterium]
MLSSCLPRQTVDQKIAPTQVRLSKFKLNSLPDDQSRIFTKENIAKLKNFVEALSSNGCNERDINNILMGHKTPREVISISRITNDYQKKAIISELGKIETLLTEPGCFSNAKLDCKIDPKIAAIFTELLRGGYTGVWFEDEDVSKGKRNAIFDEITKILNPDSELVGKKETYSSSSKGDPLRIGSTKGFNTKYRGPLPIKFTTPSKSKVDDKTAFKKFEERIDSIKTNIKTNGISYAPIDITYVNTGVMIYLGLGREANAKPGIYITLEGKSDKVQAQYVQVYYKKTYDSVSQSDKLVLIREVLTLKSGDDITKLNGNNKLTSEEAKDIFSNFKDCDKLDEASIDTLKKDLLRGTTYQGKDLQCIKKSFANIEGHLNTRKDNTIADLDNEVLLTAFLSSQIVLSPTESQYKCPLELDDDSHISAAVKRHKFGKTDKDDESKVISHYEIVRDVNGEKRIIGNLTITTTYAIDRSGGVILIKTADQESELVLDTIDPQTPTQSVTHRI